ncbi:MAG TPA: PAS domain S-box protein [Bacteroidales bacterium]|nr:PAS domain S-box protein [Bacteroidales bacterium]
MSNLHNAFRVIKNDIEKLIEKNAIDKISKKLTAFENYLTENYSTKNTEQDYFQLLFENSLAGIGLIDTEGEIIDCNPELLRILEFNNLKDFQKQNIRDFYADKTERKKIAEELYKTGLACNQKVQIKTNLNNIIVAHVNARLIELNKQACIVINVLDITDQELAAKELEELHNELEDRVNKRTKALIQSEEKFRKLTDIIPAGISILNTSRYFYVNKAWCEITGYSESESKEISPIDIIHPEMRELVKSRATARLKGEETPSRYDIKLITKNKQEIWVDISFTLIEFDGQNCILAVMADITEILKTQKALKESQEKYKSIIENLRHEFFFYRYNRKGTIEYVSPSVEIVLGYEPKQYISHYTYFLTKNPINKLAIEKTELSLSGIQQLPFEKEVYDIQHNKHILEVSETPVVDSNGNVIYIEGIAHDITERKKNEKIITEQLEEIKMQNEEIKSVNEELNAVNDDLQARVDEIKKLNDNLKESEEKFRTLVRNIPGVVYRCYNDEDWTMQFISHEIEELSGYEASDFIENKVRTYKSLILEEDQDNVNSVIQDSISKMEPFALEYRIITKANKIKWVHEKGLYLYDKDYQTGWLDGVILDITEQKNAEEELIQSEKELRKLNAQKDKYFSLLAHDLRSPIGNFLQITELLKLQYNEISKDDIYVFFDNLHTLASSTFKLLDNLLMWSRSQLGRLEIKPEKVNLHAIVADVEDLYGELIKSKKLLIKNTVPQSLCAFFDQNSAHTIIRNLMANAFKFSYPGGTIEISTTFTEKDKTIIFSVKDSGVGIPADKLENLFDPDSDYTTLGTGKEKGTGLGLILCRELVERNKGRIWVGSEPGKGSTFYFTIACCKD